ncbi:MAG: N-ethylammeline chlorohydrolase [Peptococcaceae bacterium BICA1-7]|nr:MAG: N-ethylammeline chlorohydrolase [Peptococcaceae bacterium BICA1-7]HBV98419.1 amidohydrolase [Desulfotomaculum sp.]
MEKVLIKNGLVLSMASCSPDILKKDVLVEGDRISKIGQNLPPEGVEKVIDAGGRVVMPGLINCHSHAAMALFRGYSDDLRLMDWLSKKIWPAEARIRGEEIYWGTMLASAEMIRSGTTTFADMYAFMEDVAAAVQCSGMRASLCQGLAFRDERGWSKRIKYTYRLFQNWHGQADGRITAMVGPHAPYTVPPDKMRLVIDLAAELKAAVHIHLAETSEEVDQIGEMYGKSPTGYLAGLGLFDSCPVLLAHGVHLTVEDISILRGIKGGISHNPVSNMKLGCGVAPVVDLRRAGIAVGLGTDGAGSASTLDMFQQIKTAAWLQKNHLGDPAAITAYEVLRMATVEGSRALGLEGETGALEEGKKADIIIIDIEKPHLYPHNDISSLLAYSATGADVETTIIDGRIVMENRVLLTMDEKEVMKKARQCAGKILCV